MRKIERWAGLPAPTFLKKLAEKTAYAQRKIDSINESHGNQNWTKEEFEIKEWPSDDNL
jgi:hypothetical protein